MRELENLDKYHDKITSGRVILDTEHINKTVEITVNIQGSTINAKGKSNNLGKSVDTALQKIIRQLKKVKEKVKDHKKIKEMLV